MAYIVMAYIVMAYIVLAYIVMAYIVMAYIVMARTGTPAVPDMSVSNDAVATTGIGHNNKHDPLRKDITILPAELGYWPM